MVFQPLSIKITAIFLLLTTLSLLSGCQFLVNTGLVTPSPTPDPFSHYRAILQPAAQADIEAAGPLPQYHITAQLDETGTSLSGVMKVMVPGPLDQELVFRLYPNLEIYNGSLSVTQARINQQPVAVEQLTSSAIRLPIPPGTDTPVEVDLAFTTQVNRAGPTDLFNLFGWQDQILSLPGFFPTLAVYQDGDWVLDEPPRHGDVLFNEVALYQLDITLPRDLVVASSGVKLKVIDNPNSTRTWQIVGGPLRDMTVIAGPFQTISDDAAGAVVTSYYLEGHEVAGRAALAHATASLRLYSDTYGPYPYTELDVVEAPLGNRGMEYTGLILIGSDLYTDQRQYLTFLVAHETAHQWWYSVIGNNPYEHPWLDEGLTEYSAFDYYRSVFGQPAAEQLLANRWETPFAVALEGGIVGHLNRPAAEFDPVSYELLVYGKAALFFNALREHLGDDTYRRVIQHYYTQNRYGIVTPEIFLSSVERVSGQESNSLAKKWLE
jgi:hypothetical protein